MRFQSCASSLGRRPAQAVDQRDDASEDCAGQRRLGQLEDGVSGVPHKLGAGLDQPLAQRGQRPRVDGRWRRQRAQEVGEVVGQRVQLEPHRDGSEPHAREPRPLQRVLALFDMLLGGATLVVERQDPLVRQAAVGDDEANGRKQLARMELDLGDHPAPDPLNLLLNYTAWLLLRDIEAIVRRHGLHPGLGALHAAADGNDAAVYDLMEAFRAPLAESLAVYLLNNAILAEDMLEPPAEAGIDTSGRWRLRRAGHKAIIGGYRDRLAGLVTSHRSHKRMGWLRIIKEEVIAYARHCRESGLGAAAFAPYVVDY